MSRDDKFSDFHFKNEMRTFIFKKIRSIDLIVKF